MNTKELPSYAKFTRFIRESVYALRTEAERYNSRFKQAGCERVFVRNGNSVKNLNTLAHISLLSIAITAVVTKKNISYRCVKSIISKNLFSNNNRFAYSCP